MRFLALLPILSITMIGAVACTTFTPGPADEQPATTSPNTAKERTVTGVPIGKQDMLPPSFYERYVEVDGFPIAGSRRTQNVALLEAAWIIDHVVAHRRELLHALRDRHMHFAVIAPTENLTDVPAMATLWPQAWWNYRARGWGGTWEHSVTVAGEENLLEYAGDSYARSSTTIHELAHAIHLFALLALDRTFDTRLQNAYSNALAAHRWVGTYAGSNPQEYWAEGSQSWFDANIENDKDHNEVNTRAELRSYDPQLAELLVEIYGDEPWRMVPVTMRMGKDHLLGFDPKGFSFTPAPKIDVPSDPSIPSIALDPSVNIHPSPRRSELVSVFMKNETSSVIGVDTVSATGERDHLAWLVPENETSLEVFASSVCVLKRADQTPINTFVATSNGKVIVR